MKILKISIFIPSENPIKVTEWNIARDTGISLKVEKLDSDGLPYKTEYVKHSNLGKIDTIMKNVNQISFFSWCLPKDKVKTISLLQEKTEQKILELIETVSLIKNNYIEKVKNNNEEICPNCNSTNLDVCSDFEEIEDGVKSFGKECECLDCKPEFDFMVFEPEN